ncbi:hypothetical protein F4815DRAFT_440707 [Daldinia loculata]|nr:hypothetical protein F4815DRAFT_440707 [Daldinia loculata]
MACKSSNTGTIPSFLERKIFSESTLPLLTYFIARALAAAPNHRGSSAVDDFSGVKSGIGKAERTIPDESQQLRETLLNLMNKGPGGAPNSEGQRGGVMSRLKCKCKNPGFFEEASEKFNGFSNVKAWHERMTSRDSWKAIMEVRDKLMDEQGLMWNGMPKGIKNFQEYEAKIKAGDYNTTRTS